MVSERDIISFEPCAFVGPVPRVYGVCHVLGFGFWGVTDLVRSFVIDHVGLYSIAG
ncbi:hypothetical protein SLEP1_g24429 [Rubroshorea leprosula]|uniref:Uncharacterized protein n=1 Tax=Rubroshorea leprosula TaxID=152421 RepID=A0AAV5JIS8_9ROSI|nr:hypothetical protein SLEP1_g24429 [Rubroshorea leprosula]